MSLPLVKGELQHSVACRKAQNKLRNSRETATVQGLLHNYQLFNPFPCFCSRDSIWPRTEYLPTSPPTSQVPPPPTETHGHFTRYQQMGCSTDPSLGVLAGLQSRPRLDRHQLRASWGGVPPPLWEAQSQSPAKHLQTSPQSTSELWQSYVPGGQSPTSWSINLTQGFGGKSILFILKCLSYGHGMNWNTIFTKKQKHKILYWRQTLLDLQPPKLQTFVFALLYCRRLWGKNLRNNKRPGERWPGMDQRRGQKSLLARHND